MGQNQKNKEYLKRAKITNSQRASLVRAWNWCDCEDKSTEFMFSYMSDMSGVDYDRVVDFVVNYERVASDFEIEIQDTVFRVKRIPIALVKSQKVKLNVGVDILKIAFEGDQLCLFAMHSEKEVNEEVEIFMFKNESSFEAFELVDGEIGWYLDPVATVIADHAYHFFKKVLK